MKKRFNSILLLVTLLFTSLMPITAMAADPAPPSEIKVLLDGKQLTFDVAPQIIEGRTMVPMRAIFEALGATVAWDDTTKTVTAQKESTIIQMTIGSKTLLVGEKSIELDVPPQIVDSRTLVPVRAVAESFGAEVKWDDETKTVSIQSKTSEHPKPTYSDAFYCFYDAPGKTKLLTSVNNDWYITIDPSYKTNFAFGGNNYFSKNMLENLYVQITPAEGESFDLSEYVKKSLKERTITTQGGLTITIQKDIERVTLNNLEYFTFTQKISPNTSAAAAYLYNYFTVWDNEIFEFCTTTNSSTEPQVLLDSLQSFNPKANQSETEAFIHSFLSAAGSVTPSKTDLSIQYTNLGDGQLHILMGPTGEWGIAIDGRYIIEDSDFTTFSMPNTNNRIIFNRYPFGEMTLELAANTIFTSNYDLSPKANKAVTKKMTTETIENVQYYTYAYQATDPDSGKLLYTFTYITKWQDIVFEFTCITDSNTPTSDFLATLHTFQPYFNA